MADFLEYFNDDDTTDYGFTIKELPSGQSHWDFPGQTTHTSVYQVVQETSMAKLGYRADTIAVGRYMRQLGFKIGTAYLNTNLTPPSRDQTTLLSSMDIDQSGSSDNPGVFTVTIQWGRVTNSALDMTDILNVVYPLEWGTIDTEYPLYQDYEGTPIVNKAGDRINPPITGVLSRDTLVFQRNEAFYDHALANTYRNTVNAATWNGYDAKMVLCKDIKSQQLPHPTIPFTWYFHTVYTFEFHDGISAADAASVRVLNAGWNKSDGSGGRLKITDAHGNEPLDIPLLDNDGLLLTSGDPILLDFQRLATSDFDALNITLPTS